MHSDLLLFVCMHLIPDQTKPKTFFKDILKYLSITNYIKFGFFTGIIMCEDSISLHYLSKLILKLQYSYYVCNCTASLSVLLCS